MNRRNILIGLGVVAAGAAAGGAYWLSRGGTASMSSGQTAAAPQAAVQSTAAGNMPIFDDDRILGDPAAPVTILEFSSLTCPHCAAFHRETLPQVKSEWIDSGRARLVYRHYPLDQVSLRAAAVTDCIPGNGFFGFLEVLFANQDKWARSQDPIAAIGQYAALAGLDKTTFEACLNDEAAIDRILARQSDGSAKYSIASTPTFVVNGTPVVGNRTYDEFNSALEAAAANAS
ncbi:MAG: DsbA family protein [Kiloniellaceae bacterium]